MDYQFSPNWSYKTISDTVITLYHVVLSKIPSEELYAYVPKAEYIKRQNDGSIILALSQPFTPEVIAKILSILDEKALSFLDTPPAYYQTSLNTRQILKQWCLAFQGCLALLLNHNPDITAYITSDWQFINSSAGGIYLDPFTLFLYEEYPKIIHPITIRNYDGRKTIELAAALHVKAMLKRVQEAQPGFEGIALLSMVKDKTHLTHKEIVKHINDKSYGISIPKYSPFFFG